MDSGELENLLAQGYTLLTPNLRLARSLGDQWTHIQLDKGLTVWPKAPISPLEPWLLNFWHQGVGRGILEPLLPATPAQIQLLWRDVIRQHQSADERYSLISPSAAAKHASQARDTLLRWCIDIEQPQVRQQFMFGADCAAFYAWQVLLVKRLAAKNMTTSTDCLHALLACADQFGGQKVVLFGFEEMPPLLQQLLDILSVDSVVLSVAGEPGKCIVQECPDKRGELAAAAQWLKTQATECPHAAVGIILPDMKVDRAPLEYLLRREFGCLGENYTSLPVNFSAGIAMSQVPLVRDALRILAMCRDRIGLLDIVALLRSRFVVLHDRDTSAAIRFTKRLFDFGTQQIAASEVRYLASRSSADGHDHQADVSAADGLHIGRIMTELEARRDLKGKALPSQWVERFSQILEMWCWPGGGALDSIEYQQVAAWYEFLEQFRAYDQVSSALNFEEALQLIQEATAATTSQPQTPKSNAQVLGTLEAAGQTFDKLWIVGMQASQWPAAAKPNPFIPTGIQREKNMPQATPEREWSFASNLLEQYLRSADTTIASYSVQDNGVPEDASALLDDFPRRAASLVATVNPQWLELHATVRRDYVLDINGPRLSAQESGHIGGGSGLLEDQSQCAFRAFSKRRLRVQALPEPLVGLSPAERGNILHDALFALWGSIEDSASLASLSASSLELLIGQAIDHGVSNVPVNRRNSIGASYFELEEQRFRALLHQWLAVEKMRSSFVVSAREEKIQLKLGGLEISMRADRIDKLPDGAHFVIDYKSGLCSLQDWLGERPAKPQLPLYALAIQNTLAGLSYAQVRHEQCQYIGAGQIEVAGGVRVDTEKWVKGKMPVNDWDDLIDQWRVNLERLADEFLQGQAQVDPLANSCTFCGLQSFCRIDEIPSFQL